MKPEFENIQLVKNEAKERFEIEVDGSFAFIDYKVTSSHISLLHTEAEEALLGTGAAKAVVEKTLEYIKKEDKKLNPFCTYVFSYIKRNPKWKSIVDESFNGYEKL